MNTRKGIKSILTVAVMAMAIMVTSANAEIIYDGFVSWDRNSDPGTFDASDSDKLVVVVSGEHNFPNNPGGNVTGITYNGQTLIKAVEESPNVEEGGHGQTTADIWYLDDPGSYSGEGTIDVSFSGNNWVVTAIALSGAAEGVGATAHVSGAASVDLTTTDVGSIVIASLGMGGSGNTTDINVSPDAPLTKIDALKIGSNWAGHVLGYAIIALPELQTFSFNTGKTDVVTIAAEFLSAVTDPNLPDVDLGDDWITWSGQPVTLAPVVVNNDTQVPQRTLSYVWTATPADGVVFTPNANVQSPDVTITKAADTGDATVVNLMLSVVLDGVEGIVEEDINIDVYDDSCAAAVSIGTADIFDPADFNRDCITDFEDLAAIAVEWLKDYSLTEPAEAP